MANHVFVSSSSQDKQIAQAACAALEKNGIKCWIAPRDIMPGLDWGAAIVHAIKQSVAIVLVFSSNSNRSSQVKREVERAVNKDVPIVVFRVEDIAPSESLEYYLSTHQWLDAMTPPPEAHYEKLADVMKVLLEDLEQNPRVITQSGKLDLEKEAYIPEIKQSPEPEKEAGVPLPIPKVEPQKKAVIPAPIPKVEPKKEAVVPAQNLWSRIRSKPALVVGAVAAVGAIIAVIVLIIIIAIIVQNSREPAYSSYNSSNSVSSSSQNNSNGNSATTSSNINSNSKTRTEPVAISNEKAVQNSSEGGQQGMRVTFDLATNNYENQKLTVAVHVYYSPNNPVMNNDPNSSYRALEGQLASLKTVTPTSSSSKESVEIFMPYSVMPTGDLCYKVIVWNGGEKAFEPKKYTRFTVNWVPAANKGDMKSTANKK